MTARLCHTWLHCFCPAFAAGPGSMTNSAVPRLAPLASALASRVHVPLGQRPPRGTLWAGGLILSFHAKRARRDFWSDEALAAVPAAMDEARLRLRREGGGLADPFHVWYYRGRRLACPMRCPLGSSTCPVDALIEFVNTTPAPRGAYH